MKNQTTKKTGKLTKAGFTLVESMVAISILSLSILASFTAVQGGLQNSSIAKDQTTAFYLAQEGMEFIRNKRDQNALHSLNGDATTWLSGIAEADNSSNPCYSTKICKVDVTVNSPNDIVYVGPYVNASSWGQSGVLYRQGSTGLFGYTTAAGWNPTTFKREIHLRQVATDEVEINVRVSWSSRWGEKSVLVSEILFNRQ